ncbi:MAG: tetratricopeptide repeat protein [Vicinamibacterales bacterium]
MNRRGLVTCMCLGLALATPTWAQTEQHDHMATPGNIKAGTVNFATSCSPAVKDDFNLAVAELHSFWFPEARSLFEGVLKKDPTCAIAYWGIALTHWGNPFAGQRSPQTIALGKAAIEKGQATGKPTAREKGFIDAVGGLFSSADVTTQRARVVAYEGATELVASQNKDDMEARIFWALAIAQTALPTDKTFAQNLKAAEILEPLYKKYPNHPGLAHYIIHSYDVPALAAKALPAARAYADIAPSVPHALHMPSHTFTRVGEWKESVATNIKSAAEAEKTGGMGEGLHAMDYETYAYLQMAMDKQAKGVVDHAMAVANTAAATVTAGAPGANTFAVAAMPARYAMERGQWADAQALTVTPAPNTPYTEAITHFARAIGFARGGKPAEAAADIARLVAIHDREVEMKDAYWAEQVDIQRRVAEAWVMFASGKKEEGLKALAAAADAEDLTDKAAVTPGPLAPARELYGFMLLEAGRPKEGLVALEAVTKKEPNRFLALYGAGKAAEATKQVTKAKGFYRQIVEICKDASPDRPELVYARKMAN